MIKDHVITIVIAIIPFPIGRLSVKPMEKSFTSIAINLSSVFAHTSSGSQQSIKNSINFVVQRMNAILISDNLTLFSYALQAITTTPNIIGMEVLITLVNLVKTYWIGIQGDQLINLTHSVSIEDSVSKINSSMCLRNHGTLFNMVIQIICLFFTIIEKRLFVRVFESPMSLYTLYMLKCTQNSKWNRSLLLVTNLVLPLPIE